MIAPVYRIHFEIVGFQIIRVLGCVWVVDLAAICRVLPSYLIDSLVFNVSWVSHDPSLSIAPWYAFSSGRQMHPYKLLDATDPSKVEETISAVLPLVNTGA